MCNVELAGLPGVGKTFLLEECIRARPELSQKMYVKRGDDTSLYADIVWGMRFFKWMIRGVQHSHAGEIATRMRRLARRQYALRNVAGHVLRDYGIVQPLLELVVLFGEEVSQWEWDSFIRRAYTGNRIIFLVDDLDSLLERIELKHDKTFSKYPADLRVRFEYAYTVVPTSLRKCDAKMHVLTRSGNSKRDVELLIEMIREGIAW